MKYQVQMWCGVGYELDCIDVDASYEQEALEKAVVIAESEKPYLLFDDCADVEQMEQQGLVLYVDATMEGAEKPHYVVAQNLRIIEMQDSIPNPNQNQN